MAISIRQSPCKVCGIYLFIYLKVNQNTCLPKVKITDYFREYRVLQCASGFIIPKSMGCLNGFFIKCLKYGLWLTQAQDPTLFIVQHKIHE